MKKIFYIMILAVVALSLGSVANAAEYPKKNPGFPCVSAAWSEYPSWSAIYVAHMRGLIDGRKGFIGPIEEKYQVDIELKEAEYDPCIQLYASGQVDAVCITNIDILAPSLGRKSVVVAPTSTSYGGDMVIVEKAIKDLAGLKSVPVYGLEKSVSQYLFERKLEQAGVNRADYKFVNKDPGVAAMAMQQKQKEFRAIDVWNPFALETLNKRPDAYALFDSRTIPGEIIDAIVIAESSLEKKGGPEFVSAILEAFYAVNKLMADPKERNKTLVQIGEKFSNLDLKSMETVVKQTRFYETPDQALALFTGGAAFPGGKVATDGNLMKIMERVVDFCLKNQMVDKKPSIGYGTKKEAPNADVRFDPTFLKKAASK
jgi:NitT/TauT family transport system substrate-binding protein